MIKDEFSASLLQSSDTDHWSDTHDPSEIIIIWWFAAQETFLIIINVEISYVFIFDDRRERSTAFIRNITFKHYGHFTDQFVTLLNKSIKIYFLNLTFSSSAFHNCCNWITRQRVKKLVQNSIWISLKRKFGHYFLLWDYVWIYNLVIRYDRQF